MPVVHQDLFVMPSTYDTLPTKNTIGNTRIWLAFPENNLEPTTNKYCDFHATLICTVMDNKNGICNAEFKDTQRNLYLYTYEGR